MNWKGGKIINSEGYSMVRTGLGYTMEHRIIMKNHLGRELQPYEILHHINGNKNDNRLSNLELMDRSSHMSLHFLAKHSAINRTCHECGSGTTYMRKPKGNLKTLSQSWHHLPVDKENWYCKKCHSRWRRMNKKQ